MTGIAFPSVSRKSATVVRKSDAPADKVALLADIDAAAEIIATAKAEIEALPVLNYWRINSALADAVAAVEESRSLADR